MHGFRNSLNLRELGGIRVRDGRAVKRGCFYRSGALCSLNSDELRQLEQLGIREVLDLRSDREALEMPDPILAGVRRVRISAMIDLAGDDVDYSPAVMEENARGEHGSAEEMNHTMNLFYESMLFGNPAWTELFRCLEDGDVPLLFHCTAGKDRTGTAAALILLALGADEETIFADYMQTNEYRAVQIRDFMQEHAEILGMRPDLQEVFLAWEGVRRGSLEASLSAILARYGSYEDYLSGEFALCRDDLERLKDRYLE